MKPERKTAPRENLVRGIFPMEVRAEAEAEDKDGPLILSGLFTRFDEWAEIDSLFEGRFLERHAPNSMNKTIREGRDRMQILFQHGLDPEVGDKIIADLRELKPTPEGPAYRAEVLDGLEAQYPLVVSGLRAGKYGASFRFSVIKDTWVYPEEPSDYNPEMLPERTVNESRVHEFGPVTFPAFAGASAELSGRSAIRSLTDQVRGLEAAGTLAAVVSDTATAAEVAAAASATSNTSSTHDSGSVTLRANALPLEPTPVTPPEAAAAVTSTPVEPGPPAPEENRMDPKEKAAREARMTVEERQDRQSEIRSRLEAIDRDYAGSILPTDVQTEWDDLSGELTRHAEAIKHLEARRAQVATAHALAPDGADAAPVSTPTRSEDRGSGPAYVRGAETSILSPFEIRQQARSEDHERALLREHALRRVAVSRFAGQSVERSKIQERVEKLLDEVKEDTPGTLARRILNTGTPTYDRAFHKTLAQLPLDTDEARALSLAGASGGYAVPFDLDPTIIPTGALGINPFRQIARVIPVTTDTWRGVSSGAITASYAAEATETTDNAPTLAQPDVSTEKAQAWIPFSIEVGQDWSGMRGEMTGLLAEAKDDLEATKFAVGTGTNEPQGVVTGATTTVNATTGQTFDAEDLYRLSAALPDRHQGNAALVANRAIFNLVRQFNLTGQSQPWKDLEDPTNAPNGLVGAVLGYPAWVASGMSGVTTTGTKFAVLGNFSRFVIIDRIGLEVELVPHVFGANQRPTGQRGLYAYWRNSSEVIDANAFRVLIGIA